MNEIDKESVIFKEIEEFINEKRMSKALTMTRLDTIEDILKFFGYEQNDSDGEKTNGWQVDFWYKFSNEAGETVELSGSLWYGEWKLTQL